MKNNEEIYSFNDDSDDRWCRTVDLLPNMHSGVQLTVDARSTSFGKYLSYAIWQWCKYYRRNHCTNTISAGDITSGITLLVLLSNTSTNGNAFSFSHLVYSR